MKLRTKLSKESYDNLMLFRTFRRFTENEFERSDYIWYLLTKNPGNDCPVIVKWKDIVRFANAIHESPQTDSVLKFKIDHPVLSKVSCHMRTTFYNSHLRFTCDPR